MKPVFKTLVVGIGDMGGSHARGYAALPGYQIAGFVVAKNVERAKKLAKELKVEAPVYTDYDRAMKEVKPEVVSINTYVDTHAAFSTYAMRQGCHVFMEKPIAKTVKEAEQVQRVFRETRHKLVIGYILRIPGLDEFIEPARLGSR
jgi:predicted dehydrogenase